LEAPLLALQALPEALEALQALPEALEALQALEALSYYIGALTDRRWLHITSLYRLQAAVHASCPQCWMKAGFADHWMLVACALSPGP
jgi:hypothetical protein